MGVRRKGVGGGLRSVVLTYVVTFALTVTPINNIITRGKGMTIIRTTDGGAVGAFAVGDLCGSCGGIAKGKLEKTEIGTCTGNELVNSTAIEDGKACSVTVPGRPTNEAIAMGVDGSNCAAESGSIAMGESKSDAGCMCTGNKGSGSGVCRGATRTRGVRNTVGVAMDRTGTENCETYGEY